ncbi:hypothetical protein ACQE3D_25330 (plasmid) [Methylomonas sp. MS20]|uniref:hypothetical protein n=1 Tax=Methylomonas sp. MS20 TaxID=3418769 RepID=UPI003D011D0A
MKKTIGRAGHTQLALEKPLIDGGIWLPVAVENGYVEEDGLSFSLPVDDGPYSFVTYERAVGVLADDTYSMLCDAGRRPKMISLSNYVSFRTIENWNDGLPPLTEDEVETGFWGWPQEWRDRYEQIHERHGVEDRNKPIFTFNGSELYSDESGFYARLIGWHYDRVVPVDFDEGMDFEILQDVFETKRIEIAAYNQRSQLIKENLKVLAAIFNGE